MLLNLTTEHVERIIAKHVAGNALTVSRLEEIKEYGYSIAVGSKIYIADLHAKDNGGRKTTTSCFLTVSKAALAEGPFCAPNPLPVINKLLNQIRSKTEIPISDSILDTSHDIIPFDYLLSPPTPFSSSDIITLRAAKEQGRLDDTHKALIDLQVGQFLAQMHVNVQNDWYGLPSLEQPVEPSYSWQETFTLLFETVLEGLKAKEYDYPYEDVQRYMSRAIAFFLFDDVEVPSLIWFTGSDADIYVSLPTHPSTKTPGIVAILPSMPHMLWGDPLLETFFLSLDSSVAILEGYVGGGGGPLISFPRQKTKRVWYTLFLASTLLYEYLSAAEENQIPEEKRRWAEETVRSCVELLKTAPCN